jgi:rod shape-determining protein MreC
MRQLVNALLKYRNTLLYLVLMIFSVFFLQQRSFYHRSVFSKLGLGFSSKLNDWGGNISGYFSLSTVNSRLNAENEKLKKLELYYNSLPEKTEALDSFPFEVIKAKMVKNSYNQPRNFLIIDKGSKDGITADMGVISGDGVVGIINQVTEDYSSVLSILHRDLKINAGFKKNGAYGSLSWDGKHPKKMKLEDVAALNPVEIGDTIVTAGMSDYFPYGIRLGVVSYFQKPELEGYYDISVSLFSNLTQTTYVYVLEHKKLNQLKQLKNESQ